MCILTIDRLDLMNLYNARIEIQRKTNSGTDFHPVWGWSVIETVDCLKTMLSENEIIRSEGGRILADCKVYVDVTDVTTKDRLKIDAELFKIYSAKDPNGMGHHLLIKCKLLYDGFEEETT